MKIIRWVFDNILFFLTLFLLAFIPLFPKRPLIDVVNTWVYVRAEDFVVVLVLIVWAALLFRKKITLRTPLTMPILLFWIIGGVATIHGVLLIFPSLANVFPNVAFLSFLRRIEYMSLFFIAYNAMRDKRFLPYVVAVLAATLLLVVWYGVGQKYLGFPAYLTMNEEFAKGTPIQLSALSRVPSTFGGHYDLAAYLVLIIPILVSTVFGFRNFLVRVSLLTTVSLGFVLLFMTVSRVSFFVLLVALFAVLLFQKKRFILLSFPIIAVLVLLFLSFSTSLLARFGNTIKEVDVLVDAKTGEAIGHVKKVPSEYFANKTIRQRSVRTIDELGKVTKDKGEEIVPFSALPPEVLLIEAANISTGENLPQGTGYINLSLSPVTKKAGEFFYERFHAGTQSADVLIIYGDFLIKRAAAYDLSFTTRFQGEWPRAIAAFKRNILFGSGFGSVSLAVDNNYLRLLGEVGLLGFASFLAIFIVVGTYIRKVLPDVDSVLLRSFVVGFAAGVLGLALNAIFIDVFEASKIAFLLWLLTGVVLGMLSLYQKNVIDIYNEFRKVATSTYAIILYLFLVAIVVFSPMVGNFFAGDDFTWFRWVADCSNGCPTIFRYFTEADGFFYRPGTKVYFYLMYSMFWLNQTVYHMVSLLLHATVAALLFLLARKVLRDYRFCALAAFLFLILSGYSEAVFWISSTGYLFNALFILLSLLFFILWDEKKKTIYFAFSLISLIFSLLFHELGVVTPFLIILYAFAKLKKIHYAVLLSPLLLYLIVRYFAGSHWFSGDYSYNLVKLPFNAIGNVLGYFSLTLFGPLSLPFYQLLRNFSKEHVLFAIPLFLAIAYVFFLAYKFIARRIEGENRRIVTFATAFFILALLPFLGLGNIASRYSYLASVGFILLFVFFVKKLYRYLISSGRDVGLAAVAVVLVLFCLLHIIQLQQIHSDWYEAGEKSRRFFLAIDESYGDYWANEPLDFHFVNVPIRVGEAWVFPVGIDDALWFSFRNPNIRVYQWFSVEQAMNAVSGSKNEKVFEFDSTGKVIERKKKITLQ